MKKCNFCEALEDYREVQAAGNKYRETYPGLGPYMHEYTVAIVIHSWFKALGKRSAGRSTDYRNQGLGYELNFCPECGKMINKKKGVKP